MTRTKGFTLVEMLVVIVIISMLAGLLIPAISSARARARRTQCTNNQRELAVAFQQYENAKQRLPGYINRYPAASASGQSLSWPVVLLEYIGRNDLWEVWSKVPDSTDPSTLVTAKKSDAGPTISQLTCPTDLEAGDAGLSYVVNCGIEDDPLKSPPRDSASQAVFHDRYDSSSSPPNPTDWVTFRTEKIPDGAAQTVLFSENIQASKWHYGSADNAASLPTNIEANIGMVWSSVSGVPIKDINEDKDSTAPDISHARPSSNHPGGVVVTYCDGRQEFLDESIDATVYAAKLDPDDGKP